MTVTLMENTSIPGWSVNWYGYNQRSQLVDIADASYNLWFHYTYDASGNLTKRQATKDGLNDSVNVPSYDELNRPLTWENTGTGDAVYARSHYQYDGSGREVATWRDEQVGQYGPLGERFDYNVNDQLIHARYNAEQVWSSPINERRKVDYDVDPLNRWAVWDSDNNNGNGLSATYFDSINLTGKAVTQNDATINFAWNAAPPAPGIPERRMTRVIYCAAAATVVFLPLYLLLLKPGINSHSAGLAVALICIFVANWVMQHLSR